MGTIHKEKYNYNSKGQTPTHSTELTNAGIQLGNNLLVIILINFPMIMPREIKAIKKIYFGVKHGTKQGFDMKFYHGTLLNASIYQI